MLINLAFVAISLPLLVIDHATEFDHSFDELQRIVTVFDKSKGHFSEKLAFVVSKDVHYGLGHMLHFFSQR